MGAGCSWGWGSRPPPARLPWGDARWDRAVHMVGPPEQIHPQAECVPILPVPSLLVAGACRSAFPTFGEEPVAISTEPAKGAPKKSSLSHQFLPMSNVSSKPRHCSGPGAVVQPLQQGHLSVVARPQAHTRSSSDAVRARGTQRSCCGSAAGSHPAALPWQWGFERRLVAG